MRCAAVQVYRHEETSLQKKGLRCTVSAGDLRGGDSAAQYRREVCGGDFAAQYRREACGRSAGELTLS